MAETASLLIVDDDVALLQALPQAPQLATVLVRLTSQPSLPVVLQSA